MYVCIIIIIYHIYMFAGLISRDKYRVANTHRIPYFPDHFLRQLTL